MGTTIYDGRIVLRVNFGRLNGCAYFSDDLFSSRIFQPERARERKSRGYYKESASDNDDVSRS